MRQMKKVLVFFGGLDKGLYPVMLLAALLETVEGFGVLLISSVVLDLLAQGAGWESVLSMTAAMAVGYGILCWLRAAAQRYKEYRVLRIVYRYREFVAGQVFRVPYWRLEQESFVENMEQVRQNEASYDLTGAILREVHDIMKSCFAVSIAIVSFLRLFGAVRRLGESAFLAGMLILGLTVLIVASTGYIVWRRKMNAEGIMLLTKDMVRQNKVAMYLLSQVIVRYPLGKHIRLYGMQERLQQEGKKQRNGVYDLMGHMNRMELKPSLAGDISSVAITGMIYLIVGAVAMAGGLGIGSVIWYVGVVRQLLESVREMILLASELYTDCTRDAPIFGLTEAASAQGQEGMDRLRNLQNHELVFEGVSFAYPGSDKMVLDGVDLRIAGRERIALVGRNGCGKSTLIKLICRLYEPTEGRIMLDGVDIRQVSQEEYRNFLAVVFQDYQIFAATLAENIALDMKPDLQRVKKAMEGLEIGIQDLDTPLRRDLEEDGVEVSGGEGQKVAIARALYKDGAMVILDEPTASLDPIAESEIYEKFRGLVEGKLAMFISHRLSSCRFCDRILVLQDGKIVQDGSHEELTAQKDGLYREMWDAQRQYYR